MEKETEVGVATSPSSSEKFSEQKRRSSLIHAGSDYETIKRESDFLTRNGLNLDSFKRRMLLLLLLSKYIIRVTNKKQAREWTELLT